MSDILSIINERKKTFSKSQRIIAEYITENSEKAAYMTAGKLANAIGVSESTMIRFAYELGLSGYPELQKQLKSFVKSQLTSVQRVEVACEKIGGGDILTNILKLDIGYIEKTLYGIDKAQFEAAAEAVSGAKKIYIAGVRSAAALVDFAGFYLRLIFDNVRLIKSNGGDDIFEQILNIGKGDVLIGISFPRYSKNIIKALEYAHRNGAEVVGITDSKNSPVVEKSDYSLIAESDTTSFVDSLTAPFSLINALIVAVGMKNRERMSRNLEKLEQIWDEYEVYDKK